jgi:hypothetical protein
MKITSLEFYLTGKDHLADVHFFVHKDQVCPQAFPNFTAVCKADGFCRIVGSHPEGIYDGLNILHKESRGSVDLLIVRNRRDLVEQQIEAANPAIFDLLPLSLEEIFIYELGGETIELESLLF